MITIELTIPEVVKLISICNLAITAEEMCLSNNNSIELKEMTENSLIIIKDIKAKLKDAAIKNI